MEDPQREKIKHSGRMRYSLRPRTVFVLSFLLFCLIGLANFIEYLQNRKSLLGLVRRQGYELLDVLIATGTRSILTNEALEDDLWRHLLTAAALFEEMDYRSVSRGEIAALSDRAGVDTVLIAGEGGRLDGSGSGKIPPPWAALLDSFMTSEHREIFFSDPGFPDDFAVAVKRRKGGAVIAAVRHGRIRILQRRISPGTLVQEIGSRPGIAYVAIQDTLGIYMASRGVTVLSSIRDDSLLSRVYRGNNRDSRFAGFRGERIMEVAGAFNIEEERKGVLRLGLRLDIYEQYLRGLGLRLLLTLLLFGFILIIGISLLVVTRKEQWISESYARSAVRTAMIMDYLQNGVIATDQKGIITLCNPAAERILETPRDRLIGRSARDLEPECFRLIASLFDTGRTAQQEERDCLVNGVLKRLVISTSMVPGRDGGLDAAVMVMADVTRERRLEEQVQRQEKLRAMGTLASGVAHEIRNPINAIGMIGQRLIKEFTPGQDRVEYAELTGAVVREVQRINGIIESFLRFAQPAPILLQPEPAEQVLKDTALVFQSSADSRGVVFFTRFEPARISADRRQLHQALLNLLGNALDATPPGGSITFTGVKTDFYQIEVADSGAGIPDAVKHRIFDLYFSTKPSGTGLGLPVVQQIIAAHGGQIDFESEQGKGTRFRIRIPLETET